MSIWRYIVTAVARCSCASCLLPPARALVELAKPEVAVGNEGTHAELVGEDEPLVILAFGLHSLGGIAVRSDVTEEPEGIGLVST
jgi:hypothetical protein